MFLNAQVAEIFCTAPRLKPFHEHFISCNEVVNSTEWCCKCDKCAFVYIILSGFLTPREVQSVFHGKDLLSDWDMCDKFLSLVGGMGDGEKPFECVGTALETQAAVEMAIGQLLKTPEQYENLVLNGGQEKTPSVPAGLLLVCEYLGLSKYDLPEYAALPLHEQLSKLLKKYIK